VGFSAPLGSVKFTPFIRWLRKRRSQQEILELGVVSQNLDGVKKSAGFLRICRNSKNADAFFSPSRSDDLSEKKCVMDGSISS